MAHQIILNLSDEEYAALAAAAAQQGQPVEDFAHDTLEQKYSHKGRKYTAHSYRELLLQMQADGEIVSLPLQEGDSFEDDATLEALITRIGSGKSLSDMVIEDRGPR